MKKALIWGILLVMVVAAVPAAAHAQEDRLAAVGFNVHGYYRVRYDNLFDLGWATGGDSNHWSWIDQRMILQPTLVVADSIQIVMELDLLGNVMFGDNAQDMQPVLVTERKPNDLETIDYVTQDELNFRNGGVLSESMSNSDRDLEDVDPINIRQLYMRVALPIGALKIGRQSVHWGMGLFMNSGSPYGRMLDPVGSVYDRNSGFDGDGGDNYDRVLFTTRVADFYMPYLAYDRLAEDDFRTGDYDVHSATLANEFRNITFSDSGVFDSGFFIQSRTQHATEANLWVYDVWGRLAYGGFTWELEAFGVQGSAKFVDDQTVDDLKEAGLPTGQGGGTVSISAYTGVGRFEYDSGRWGAGLEGGFSSPSDPDPDNEFNSDAADAINEASQYAATDPDNPTKKAEFINTVANNQDAFGRALGSFGADSNYNIDLITWDRLMGGSLANGAFVKASGFIRPLDGMHIQLDVLNSYVNEAYRSRSGNMASHDLGWEFDLNYGYTFDKHFTVDTEAGYMLPGNWFRQNFDNVKNVYTIQLRTIVDF
jgi:hypothetical protein